MALMRRTRPSEAATLGLPRGQRSGIATVRSLLPYLWPNGDRSAKLRVIAAMGLLILAKLATVYVPIVYGRLVDTLAPKDSSAMLAVPLALVLAYGGLRVGSAAFGELRDALFAKVQQRAVRMRRCAPSAICTR